MLNFNTLRAQLLGLFSISQTLLLAFSLAGFYVLSESLDNYQRLLEGPMEQSAQIEGANVALKDQVQAWKNFLLRGSDPSKAEKYWRQFEEHEAVAIGILRDVSQSRQLERDAARQVDQLLIDYRQMGAAYRKGRDIFAQSGYDAAVGDQAVEGVDRAVSAELSRLVDVMHDRAVEGAAANRASADKSLMLATAALVLAAFVIGVTAIWLINRRLVRPIQTIIAYIDDLSSGKITRRLENDRDDELGKLGGAANHLRDTLATTFEQLQQNSSALDTSSGELNSIATEMGAGAKDQFSRTDQVATAMHEMSATAQEVSRYAAEAAQAADNADQSAKLGEGAMHETVQSISDMRSQIDTTAQILARLEGDSERIGKVLEVISGIADQTNLLALNAAIEAARAGEAGRGFAVVADEVRSLARKTAESTAEIQQIIEAVQTGAAEAVESISIGQSRGSESVNRVAATGELLRNVTQAVESIRDMNRQIATAAEEQTSVSDDISRNLTEITMVATNTLDRVQQTLDASEALGGLSSALRDLTQRLTQLQ